MRAYLRWFWLALGGWVGWCFPGAVQASVVYRATAQEMVQQAQKIFYGRVVGRSTFQERQTRHLYTRVRLLVFEGVKNSREGEEIPVQVLGGKKGQQETRVPGAATMRLGQEVLLFVSRKAASAPWMVVGLSYGRFLVVREPATGERLLRPSMGGLNLHGPTLPSAKLWTPRLRLRDALHHLRTLLQNRSPSPPLTPQLPRHLRRTSPLRQGARELSPRPALATRPSPRRMVPRPLRGKPPTGASEKKTERRAPRPLPGRPLPPVRGIPTLAPDRPRTPSLPQQKLRPSLRRVPPLAPKRLQLPPQPSSTSSSSLNGPPFASFPRLFRPPFASFPLQTSTRGGAS